MCVRQVQDDEDCVRFEDLEQTAMTKSGERNERYDGGAKDRIDVGRVPLGLIGAARGGGGEDGERDLYDGGGGGSGNDGREGDGNDGDDEDNGSGGQETKVAGVEEEIDQMPVEVRAADTLGPDLPNVSKFSNDMLRVSSVHLPHPLSQ